MNEAQERLRQHVTSTAFDLSLRKTHIAALVWLEELRLHNWDSTYFLTPTDHSMRRVFSNLVTGFKGLIERGLVTHHWKPGDKNRVGVNRLEDGTLQVKHDPTVWKITKAGKLVIALLKECGLYEEFAKEIRPLDERGNNGNSQGREAS